jgi:hypothetical protein
MKKLTNLIAFMTFLAVATVAVAQDGGGSTGTGHIISGPGGQPTAKAARTGGSWVELLRAALASGKRTK